MATSDKWRLHITANAGWTGMVGIGDWQLRTQTGVARPFQMDTMAATVFDGGAASLGGPAALTQYWSTYSDYDAVTLTLPFNIQVGSHNTNKVTVNNFGMVSFGHDGTNYSWQSNLDIGNQIPYPTIVHGMPEGYGGSAFQKVYAGAENGGATYRIRLEMFAGWDDPLDGTVNTIWELTFTAANPDRIRIDFGTSGYADVPDGSGVIAAVGSGTGAAHIATFPSVINKQYTVITSTVAADGVVTASSADSYNPATNSVDGRTNTAWIANLTPSTGTPVTLEFDFADPKTVVQYTISHGSPYLELNAMPRDWTLQYWDGSAWQTQDAQTAQTGWTSGQVRTFNAADPSNEGDVTLPALSVSAQVAAADAIIGSDLVMQHLSLTATSIRGNDGDIIIGNNNNLGTVYNQTPFTLSAVLNRGFVLFGDISLDEVTLAGSLEGPLPLPVPTLDALGHAGTVARGTVRLQALDVAAATLDPLTLRELDVSATGVAGTLARGEASLPYLQVDGAALAGTAGHGAVRLDPLVLTATIGTAGNITLPQPAVSATGLAGTAANGALLLNRLDIAATGLSDQLPAAGQVQLPLPQLAATMLAGRVASGSIFLLAPSVAASGQGDAILTGATVLDPLHVSGAGTTGPVGNGAVSLPRWQLAATGTSPLPDNAADGALVLAPLQAAGVMLGGRVANGNAVLAAPTLAAILVGDRIGDGALTLRAPTVSATGVNTPAGVGPGEAAGVADLPQLELEAAGVAGTLAGGAVQLPRMLLTASMLGERIGSGAVNLSRLLVDGRMGETAAAPAHATLTLPTWQVGAAATGGSVLDGSIQLPRLQVAASKTPELIGDGDVLLPAARMAGTLGETAAAAAHASVSLPEWRLAGVLATGGMAEGAVLLRAPGLVATGHASTEAQGELRLATLQAAGAASGQVLIHGDLALPELAAAGSQSATVTGAVRLRQPELAAIATQDAVIHGDVSLLQPQLDADAVPGNIAVAAITVPLLAIDADGYFDTVGTASVELPLLVLEGVAVASIPAPVFTGVAVNTRNQAVSTYEGLGFNSLTSFGGMVLAATSEGIVALTGETDLGAPIPASVTSGVSSFDSEQFKRVLCGYAGYSATGNLELTLVTDTHHQYVYSLVPEQVGQLHSARVKFGRGIEGRYWQWKLANKLGAHFALDALTLDVSPLSRRT